LNDSESKKAFTSYASFSEEAEPFSRIPIVAAGFDRLKRELPTNLHYHNLDHVVDVFNEAILFGQHDCLPPRSLELLAVGAVFHDMGFIERGQENESLGANFAALAMSSDGSFSVSEINTVETMILDTQVRFTDKGIMQVPTTELSRYLCDADVSNLGRTDFFEKAELVRVEVGQPDPAVFVGGLRKFLASHRWYSPAAIALRQPQKELNVAELNRRYP
jgi:predicted metal-dependent HD superfamily phosphohydrolase